MKGIPKHLAMKQDYLNIMGLFEKNEWGPRFQELIDNRYTWVEVGPIEGEGVTDDTHKVSMGIIDGEEVPVQLELQEDPNAKIFRLGFTVEEVNAYLAD
jgi:hypothetical protein